MKTYKYFTNPQTLEQLRQQYKTLAMKHHPNCGGNTADMQDINNEYNLLFAILKDKHAATQEADTTVEQDNKYNEAFKDIISKIIHFEGVEIEIIGSWIWITGNTYNYSAILVSKARMNKKAIAKYRRNQLEEDYAADHLTLKWYVDLFTGGKNK